jgi:hypothetical protein
MKIVTVAPIVEGHGEVESIRGLIERITWNFGRECVARVLRPIRVPKAKAVADRDELLRAVDLAALNLAEAQPTMAQYS